MPMWKKFLMSVMLICGMLAVTGCGEQTADGPRKEGDYQKIKLVMSVNGTNSMRYTLGKIEDIICAICLIIMTTLTFANVIARYVFSASFSFSEEITTYLFVMLSLIGSAAAARRKAHLGFTAILDLLPAGLKRAIQTMSYALATFFSAALFWYGLSMVQSQIFHGQVTAGMQWPEWIFGAFVPLGAFFITVEFLFMLIDTVTDKGGDAK